MKTCMTVLLCVLLITCLSGCSLLSILVLLFSQNAFHADITFTDLSGGLYWDEAPAYTVEYLWGVKIDWDANAITGDPDGFDVFVWVGHESLGGGSEGGVPLDEKIIDASGYQVFSTECWEWIGSGISESVDSIVEWNVSGNRIGLTFDFVGQEQASAPAAGFRTRFFASYYPPPSGPSVSDETSIVTESASTTDAAGDAGSYPFIDIVSAQISYTPPQQ
jgi:hypothetical protein